jgi:hypothetical protein
MLGLLRHGTTLEFVRVVAGGAKNLAGFRVQRHSDTLLRFNVADIGRHFRRG